MAWNATHSVEEIEAMNDVDSFHEIYKAHKLYDLGKVMEVVYQDNIDHTKIATALVASGTRDHTLVLAKLDHSGDLRDRGIRLQQ
mmetsp:Transcript_22957/g.35403  ORF Transcript_22957/g.35403 Transcript_22957/m.35403 type:complete len:85 (+) Transcript_22957:1312-1566(+)